MSVTVINAGTQHNVIPDKCSFVVDIRSNELYSNEELFAEIKKHISCDAKARSYRLNSSQKIKKKFGFSHFFEVGVAFKEEKLLKEREKRIGVIGWASDLVTSMYIQITFYKKYPIGHIQSRT